MHIWPRLRIITQWPFYVICTLMACCYSPPRVGGSLPDPPPFTGGNATAAAHNMNMLSWIGGLSILGGIAAMVITRGSMGTRALGVGIGLILLNYAVARYAHWIFIPVLVATAAISLTYAYQIVRKALLKQRNKT